MMTHDVDTSSSRYFDPPIENYRFMQAEGNGQFGLRMSRSGRRNMFVSQSYTSLSAQGQQPVGLKSRSASGFS